MAYKNVKKSAKCKTQKNKLENTKNPENKNHKKHVRTHKDRLFRFIFNQKTDLLSLYNAINESDYTNEDDLTIYTMNDFIYMGMKNDLSFLIDCNLNVFEHQSTYNPNMPLRGFLYMASALKKYISAQNSINMLFLFHEFAKTHLYLCHCQMPSIKLFRIVFMIIFSQKFCVITNRR